jgi:hypothetical protein
MSWVDLPSFATSSKIWPNFSNEVFFNLKLSKNHINKICAPNLLFFNEKKIRKIQMIFDIENSLCELAKLGKACQDAYNHGGWLILLDCLKNWVAECVASEVNDFTSYEQAACFH